MSSYPFLDLDVPPGVDPVDYVLLLPALKPPARADIDITMTIKGPDQVWYVVAAVLCISLPALFLALRVYTRLAIVGCLEWADCTYAKCSTSCSLTRFRLSIPSLCVYLV